MSIRKESAKSRTRRLPQTALAPHLTSIMVPLLAMVSAMAVANVYFAQPLLDTMATDLNVSPSAIGQVFVFLGG
ncbi:hypothetical protein [Yersinia intermedia]|uniref:hypothetical protein n=1 Tax=Yersinia intermedia TaxID=631 RepID=UPI0005E90CBF|nr:hypothetical protein [Yersinia intermedia]CNI26810.1 putative transporter protein [Yersinia intermedia]